VRIGFTGTRRGMTAAQMRVLRDMLAEHDGEFHHGDCIGADAQSHDVARDLLYEIIVHPPVEASQRAFRLGNLTREPLPYLDRNKAIVHETEVLIAAPGEDIEHLRSDTWSTVRFARKLGRAVWVILPSGAIRKE
jgi:hypothetical protein